MKRSIRQHCAAIVAAINAHNYDLAKQLATQLEHTAEQLPPVAIIERPPRPLPAAGHRQPVGIGHRH